MASGYWLGFPAEARELWGARRPRKKALDIQGCITHTDTPKPREDEIIDDNGDG